MTFFLSGPTISTRRSQRLGSHPHPATDTGSQNHMARQHMINMPTSSSSMMGSQTQAPGALSPSLQFPAPPPLSPSMVHHQSPYFTRSASQASTSASTISSISSFGPGTGGPNSNGSIIGENDALSSATTSPTLTPERLMRRRSSRQTVKSASSLSQTQQDDLSLKVQASGYNLTNTVPVNHALSNVHKKPVSAISDASSVSRDSTNTSSTANTATTATTTRSANGRKASTSTHTHASGPASSTGSPTPSEGHTYNLRTPRTSTNSSSSHHDGEKTPTRTTRSRAARLLANAFGSLGTTPSPGPEKQKSTSLSGMAPRPHSGIGDYTNASKSSGDIIDIASITETDVTMTDARERATGAAVDPREHSAYGSSTPVPSGSCSSPPSRSSRKRRSSPGEPNISAETTLVSHESPAQPTKPLVTDSLNIPDNIKFALRSAGHRQDTDGYMEIDDVGHILNKAESKTKQTNQPQHHSQVQPTENGRSSSSGTDAEPDSHIETRARGELSSLKSDGAGYLAGSPNSTPSRKTRTRDYGDRFIPIRDGSNLSATYQLVTEGIELGLDGLASATADAARRAELEKSRRKTHSGGEIDMLKAEANHSYSQLLKHELFGSIATSPGASASSINPAGSSHLPSKNYVPVHHNHHPAGTSGTGVNALPPLPTHSSSAPSAASIGAFSTNSTYASGSNRASGVQTNASLGNGLPAVPATPSRKKMFTYASPSRAGTPSSPSSKTLTAVSPGNFGLGKGRGNGVGAGFEDMLSEKYSLSPIGIQSQKMLLSPRRTARTMSKTPFKVLDAPDLQDDFYLNLVSWSQSNILAVGLASTIYLWDGATAKVNMLCDLNKDNPGDMGSCVAVGTNKGKVEIWDAEKCKRIRTMDGHTGRIGTLAWNGSLLSTGSRDRSIYHRDVRIKDDFVRHLKGHTQEVCGLKWNLETNQLASGGNDNKLFLWEKDNDLPLYRFSEHQAAVKAIAWSPHQRGLLASGGGTADKKIRFWNGLTGTLLSEHDTGSQVCNIMWSKNSNEIVSTHGYSGGLVSNQICIWRYPTMDTVATLVGHTFRVLFLAMSPDGQTIVTGSGDETLRFWNAFQRPRSELTRVGDEMDGNVFTNMLSPPASHGGLGAIERMR